MSFKKKLVIAFSIVIVLPLVLGMAVTFMISRLMVPEVSMVSPRLTRIMLLSIIIILIITSVLLTRWLQASILRPVDHLNTAMKKIRDGNLEYVLQTDEEGEIGELYRNYEDMRLRLKESAEEKLENEKNDRELISNIAHDLKTPITSIRGYAEGLLDGVANTPEKQEKYLRTIHNKASDMVELINELTLYSRIDSNRIPYSFHRINLGDYFRDCVEEIGMDMDSRGIELNYVNLVSQDTLIIADPEQLKRVINNIISNSVKYMDKPRGRIDIRILDEQDSVRIEIEDNGKGISQRDLPNIFDRFYRTDSAQLRAGRERHRPFHRKEDHRGPRRIYLGNQPRGRRHLHAYGAEKIQGKVECRPGGQSRVRQPGPGIWECISRSEYTDRTNKTDKGFRK